MKVVYTEDALRDLDETLAFIGMNYPNVLSAFVIASASEAISAACA